jgi:excisionase family DNA binding protein
MPVRISMSEAAQRIGVDTQTIRKYIAEGRLPAYRLGDRVIRLNVEDVEALLIPL